jgi:hypothetical protein
MNNTFSLNIKKLLETSKGSQIFNSLLEMKMIDDKTKINTKYGFVSCLTLYNYLLKRSDIKNLKILFQNGVNKNLYYYIDVYDRYIKSSTLKYCVINNNFELLKFFIKEGCKTKDLIKFMIKNRKMIENLDYILEYVVVEYDDLLSSIELDNYFIFRKLMKKNSGKFVYIDILKRCIKSYSLNLLKDFLNENGFDNKNREYITNFIKEIYMIPKIEIINRRELVYTKNVEEKLRGNKLLELFSNYYIEENMVKKMKK